MTSLRPLNDTIVIRFKKKADELVTASGIILPLVEQDMNLAEVVAVPDKKTYETIERGEFGTPVRNPDGTPKIVTRHIYVQPGDNVIMEKAFHHEYDRGPERHRVDHTYYLADLTNELDDGYDYFLTKHDDILAKADDGNVTGDGNVFGELFSQIPVKPIQQV